MSARQEMRAQHARALYDLARAGWAPHQLAGLAWSLWLSEDPERPSDPAERWAGVGELAREARAIRRGWKGRPEALALEELCAICRRAVLAPPVNPDPLT